MIVVQRPDARDNGGGRVVAWISSDHHNLLWKHGTVRGTSQFEKTEAAMESGMNIHHQWRSVPFPPCLGLVENKGVGGW